MSTTAKPLDSSQLEYVRRLVSRPGVDAGTLRACARDLLATIDALTASTADRAAPRELLPHAITITNPNAVTNRELAR